MCLRQWLSRNDFADSFAIIELLCVARRFLSAKIV